MPKIHPCRCPEGHFLMGEPAIARDVTKAEAARLTATLAFTLSADGLHAPPDEATTPTPDPADAGSLDS